MRFATSAGEGREGRKRRPCATLALLVLHVTTGLACCLLGVGSARAGDGEAHIHLRGTARIDAHTARAAGKLLLSGVVVDDAAHPMAGVRVALAVSRATAGASDPAGVVALANAAPAACSDGAAPPTTERGDTLVLAGDEAGRFCVRLSLPTDRYVAHLEARPQGLVDGAKLDLPIDLSLAPLTLRFDPEPSIVMLDDESATFEVVASTEDDGVTVAAAGLGLALSREGGAALASAITNASGRVRFGVDSGRLGPPGRGELRVSFAGSAEAGAATRVASVERHTWVELTVPDASEGRLPAGSPEDGIPLRVVATAGCARRGCAGTPSGTIEARVGSNVVGVAALQSSEGRSEAHLLATFPMPATDVENLELRYIPDAPWFRPRGELTMTQPLRSPSPWRKAPLLLAALGVLAWLVLARLSPRERATAPKTRPSRAPRPEPSIALVAAGRTEEGWKGRLRDAHDGGPVAGARVAVERRGFERIETVAQAWSETDGTFRLPALASEVPGDEIVAEGHLHALLRRPLPPAGELDIALILRKRALLERLVAWARGRGAPFDARPEPTPGHVRRAAGSEFTVARWADAVERAAYGGQNVDAAAQAEIERLAPTDPVPHTDPHPQPHPEPHPGSPEHVDGARRRSL
jgi:hypothetical protein